MEPRNLWPDFSEFSAEFNIWPTRTFLPWRGERRIFATRVHGVTSTCTLRFLPSLDLCKRAVCTRRARTSQTFVKSTGYSSKISYLSNTELRFSVAVFSSTWISYGASSGWRVIDIFHFLAKYSPRWSSLRVRPRCKLHRIKLRGCEECSRVDHVIYVCKIIVITGIKEKRREGRNEKTNERRNQLIAKSSFKQRSQTQLLPRTIFPHVLGTRIRQTRNALITR